MAKVTGCHKVTVPMIVATCHPPSVPFFLCVSTIVGLPAARGWGHGVETAALLRGGGKLRRCGGGGSPEGDRLSLLLARSCGAVLRPWHSRDVVGFEVGLLLFPW